MMDHRAPAPQESVEMHHDRQGRHAVPIIGHQDIVAAVAEFTGDVAAAGREGLGGGNHWRGKKRAGEHRGLYKCFWPRGHGVEKGGEAHGFL